MLKRFARDERGATVVEYGLIVAVLSLAMIGGFGMAGDALVGLFQTLADMITGTAV